MEVASLVQRIEELEVKAAFQEHTLAQLDEELRKSITRTDDLKRKLEELMAEQAANTPAPINEPPPHY